MPFQKAWTTHYRRMLYTGSEIQTQSPMLRSSVLYCHISVRRNPASSLLSDAVSCPSFFFQEQPMPADFRSMHFRFRSRYLQFRISIQTVPHILQIQLRKNRRFHMQMQSATDLPNARQVRTRLHFSHVSWNKIQRQPSLQKI